MTSSNAQRDVTLSRRVLNHVDQLRRGRGITVEKLAEKITDAGYPIAHATLANRFARRGSPLILDEAYALASALGVTVDELIAAATAPCPRCSGSPPAGFLCGLCGSGDGGTDVTLTDPRTMTRSAPAPPHSPRSP